MSLLCRFWTTEYQVESRMGTALPVVLTRCHITVCLSFCVPSVQMSLITSDMPKYGDVCSHLWPFMEIGLLDDISISVSVCLYPFYPLSDYLCNPMCLFISILLCPWVSWFRVICPNMELSVSHCPFYRQFLSIFCPWVRVFPVICSNMELSVMLTSHQLTHVQMAMRVLTSEVVCWCGVLLWQHIDISVNWRTSFLSLIVIYYLQSQWRSLQVSGTVILPCALERTTVGLPEVPEVFDLPLVRVRGRLRTRLHH